MKRNISIIALLIFSVSVFAVATGCGKKGPPLPPEEEKSITAPTPTEKPAEPSAPAPSGEEPKKEPVREPAPSSPSSPY